MKAFTRLLPQHPQRLRRHMQRWRLLLAAGLLCLVSACGAKSEEDTTATAGINGYNATDQGITPFYVNNYGGFSINAYAGAGTVCCVVYPKKWHPGLTAKVRWATSTGKSYGDPTQTWHEAVVPIEPYDVPGTTMNVHFLPENKVRILISSSSPRAEGYKGPPYPEAPPGWTTKPPEDDIGKDDAGVPTVRAMDVPPPPAPPAPPARQEDYK